jgi:acylglycerol lipase
MVSENQTQLMTGLSDYGLRYSPHIKHFLKAGFRVIIPDLPSVSPHRTSLIIVRLFYRVGHTHNTTDIRVNSYVPSLLLLPAALHCVLTDVLSTDIVGGREQRKVFLSGA